jgi:DNA modification methylase
MAKKTKPAPPPLVLPPRAGAWPADNVERRPIKDILAYPQNPRIHSDEQIDALVRSFNEFGWTMPILVDEEGVCIVGHGRLQAATRMGIVDAPVMVASGWTEEQKRAYRIADNALTEASTWSPQLLRIELGELALTGYDLKLTGFDDFKLVQYMAQVSGQDPEATPEPPAIPVSRTEDLWLLGKHRFLCGDATAKTDVELLLDDAKPHLMVTDPPYGVDYDPDWRNHAARHSIGMGNRAIGAGAIGKVSNDDRADWSAAWTLFSGDVVYAWSPPGDLLITHHNSIIAAGFDIRMQIIWGKQQFAIGRGNYHVQHEPCWYAVRRGKTAHWNGDRTQSTLWLIDKPHKSETGHSTQKPIECMKRPIENNSRPGESVYDPFVGSGTTIIAAEMTSRVCLALEIDPVYVDVAVRRWQDYTKQQATLEATGQTFDEVARERLATPSRARKNKKAKTTSSALQNTA